MAAGLWFIFLLVAPFYALLGQGDDSASNLPVKVVYAAFRPAKWEEKAVIEAVNEKRNLGGLLFVYYKNTSDNPVPLREWYLGQRESGHFRLSGDVAWDRRYTDVVQPGQTTVLEICGTSGDFQAEKETSFSILGQQWQSICNTPLTMHTEKVRMSSITFDSSLTEICVHLKSQLTTPCLLTSISVEGKQQAAQIATSYTIQPAGQIIVRITLKEPFKPGELAIFSAQLQCGDTALVVYSHRNAYGDFVPNGTWDIHENQYQDAATHHLNTMVRGGHSDDAFFANDFRKTNIKTMTHTGLYPDVDMLRDLAHHPAVACWYIHDEPDWLYTPQLVMTSHEITKKYAREKPTLITFCRNVRFFEYAFIPDIPCHDHYSVTAPSSSTWPYPYGTRLEETGYYTADLKAASEPKPIWVWTQGVHLWSERPKLPLPSPDELGAQLYYNLSRGAKGNLWFTFLDEAGKKYPDTKKALQQYGRMVKAIEKDLPLSDPWDGKCAAPAEVDVSSLLTPDKLIVFVQNKQYAIRDTAYLWSKQTNINIQLALPDWLTVNEGFEFDPLTGCNNVAWSVEKQNLTLRLDELQMGKVFIFSSSKHAKSEYQTAFQSFLKKESSAIQK